MLQTRVLRAAQGYVPMIKFKGHHNPPAKIDHTPQAHPASPSGDLPNSFAAYRQKSQQHGPLGHKAASSSGSSGGASTGFPPFAGTSETVQLTAAGQSMMAYGRVGAHSGREFGSVQAAEGVAFDRSELPARFGRLRWTPEELEAVESGGASMW